MNLRGPLKEGYLLRELFNMPSYENGTGFNSSCVTSVEAVYALAMPALWPKIRIKSQWKTFFVR